MNKLNVPIIFIVAGPAYVSPGVKVDAGGFAIVNGRLVRIPPRGPAFQKATAAYHVLESIEGIENTEELRAAAERLMVAAATELAEKELV